MNKWSCCRIHWLHWFSSVSRAVDRYVWLRIVAHGKYWQMGSHVSIHCDRSVYVSIVLQCTREQYESQLPRLLNLVYCCCCCCYLFCHDPNSPKRIVRCWFAFQVALEAVCSSHWHLFCSSVVHIMFIARLLSLCLYTLSQQQQQIGVLCYKQHYRPPISIVILCEGTIEADTTR